MAEKSEKHPFSRYPNMHVLETHQRFSKSLIWDLQREYFQQKGLDAWVGGDVPDYVTNNPMIAQTYAEIIFAFFRDLDRNGQRVKKIYFLELGTGSGRLAFHLLRILDKMCATAPFPIPSWCYVMTDIPQGNIDFWEGHEQFKEWFEAGKLDTAVFDVAEDSEIQLRKSGQLIQAGSLQAPVVVIANYLFDSVPMDLYGFRDGEIFECLLNIATRKDPLTMENDALLKKLEIRYSYSQVESPIYPEPILNEILQSYGKTIRQSHVLFPFAGLRCIDRLRRISQKGMLLLMADHGHHLLSELEKQDPPKLSRHGGSFSLSVNFHAFEAYCKAANGLSLHPNWTHYHINILAQLYVENPTDFTELNIAYDKRLNQFGPDDFYSLKQVIEASQRHLYLGQMISILRFSGFDALIFMQLAPFIRKQLRTSLKGEQQEVMRAMDLVWEGYFRMGELLDVPFEIGAIMQETSHYVEAIDYFMKSDCRNPEVRYQMAACHAKLGENDHAIAVLKENLSAFPDDKASHALLDVLAGS